FAADGWNVRSHATTGVDKLGIVAEHQCAIINEDPLKPKKAYFLEGPHYDMGYLLGTLAEPVIARMTSQFVHGMIWDLIVWHPRPSDDPAELEIVRRIKDTLGGTIGDLMKAGCRAMKPDIPSEYLDELRGIREGCVAANAATEVTFDDLLVLNFGIDWFMANVYTLFGLTRKLRRAVRRGLAGIQPPGACNGFALFNGAAANGGFLFGRDFMFPTGGVFEDTACLIIQKPDPVSGEERRPFVSLTAPGLIGSIVGMNDRHVAIGVDIAPAAAADPKRPGFNSLPLNRYTVEKGDSAARAADVIVGARRGVPWIYIIADGTNDRACVVEATRYDDANIDYWKFPPCSLKRRCFGRRRYLPSRRFLRDHKTADQRHGVMIRWEDYAYDPAYLIPEIRYASMTPWIALLFGKLAQDSQWRYDALNKLILDGLETARLAGRTGIDPQEAREILRFLDPTGTYGDYYGAGKEVIEGAQSLCDLKAGTIESHYGYYVDRWVKLTLGNYI
ncbi:MAG: putative coding region, partial [Candidatus Aminicenantes bacterium]|nr:putative coding region [Candidatus Aminicenantes bacterium]